MNKKKLNPLALMMAEDLIKARPNLPLTTAIGVANFKMGALAGQLKIQLDTRSGFGNTPANIYQLLLIGSGAGKGASQGLLDNFYFKDAWDYIDNVVYPQFRKKAVDKLEKDESERSIHNWVKEVGSVTESGLLAMAESYSLCKIGGLVISVDEISNAVVSKAEVFELLLQPYDSGLYVPKAKRSDSEAMTVSNMNTCLFAFGNKEKLFEGDNVEASFLNLMAEGYSRRFIVIDDESMPVRRTADDVIKEMKVSDSIIKQRANKREEIKSLICNDNLDKVLSLSDNAMYEWARIKADGDNYILDNKGLGQAIKSDMTERSFKTAKLACIYAFFEGKNEVSDKHMIQAFEVVKQSSEAIVRLTTVKPKHERLLDALLLEDKPVTSSHILGYKFIPNSYTRKVLEYIELAKELASERGYIWKQTSRKGVEYYKVSSKEKPSEKKVLDEVDKSDKEKKYSDAEKKRLQALLLT